MAPAPSDAEVRRTYDPGPLVREEEHTIPVFAKPEAELRAEFAARFGGTRPAGFDAGRAAAEPAEDKPAGDDDADPDRPRAAVRAALAGEPDRYGQDAAENEAERTADVREDPQAAASAAEGPVTESPARPTADDTPDPGVPAEHHEDAEAHSADGRTGAPTRAPSEGRGAGHPDSWFGALMERLEAGGPLDPPVNTGRPGPGAAAGSGRRPSASALGGPDVPDHAPPADAAAVDPRAAAIRAAREAARGGGARPDDGAPAGPVAASAPSVDWSDEVASEDDVSLEESGLVGRPVVERLLGARLLEERPHESGF